MKQVENKEEIDDKLAKGNITVLGWVAFFGGLSQDMIVPILPLFYTQILGMNKATVGLIEGSLTTVVSVFRIIAGFLSDRIGKRKSIVFVGYLFSAISRLFLAFFNGINAIFAIRMLDGLGKGVKDAPRDALVAKSSKMKSMGFAFGYQRMLDTLGSFVGPLITTGLLAAFASFMDIHKYKIIFIVSGTIAFITIFLISFFVKERNEVKNTSKYKFDISVLKGKFLLFFIVMLVFTLGNSSDAFLILRAQNAGVNRIMIPVILALFNLFYALLSVPGGILSDKIGRVRVIKIGWLIYAATYLGFALAKTPWHIWFLYGVYGIYYALTEGVAKSLVAHLVEERHRGAAFGLYNASLGLLALPASTIAGFLWDKINPSAPFYFGFLCAILAVVLISLFKIEE